MDLTKHPTKYDVKVLMKSASFWPNTPDGSNKDLYALEQAEVGIASAIGEWEQRTAYWPFFSPAENAELSAAQTIDYYPNGKDFVQAGILPLDNGLLRLDGVKINSQSVGTNGGVILQPTQNKMKNRPYSWLQFPNRRVYGIYAGTAPLHVQVTGRFGYCTVYPGDVWQQILQAAALIALIQIENLQNIGSLSVDGFSKSFDTVGVISQKDILTTWGKDFDKCIMRYKRITA